MSEWTWYYLTFKPGARLLGEQPITQHGVASTDHGHKQTIEDRPPVRRAA
jgi:NADH dehydrogenase